MQYKSAATYKSELAASREALFGSDSIRVSPLETIHAYTDRVDAVLSAIYESTIVPKVSTGKVAVIALGGYGRRELCPFSDVDILVLHEDGAAEAIGSAVRLLWDIGLNMGSVVRTLSQCASLMGDDMSSDTALLESRYIAGDGGLYAKLQDTVISPHFTRQKKSYIDEIGLVLREGLFSMEQTLYRVEPYIKEGVCGLRDCQRLLWAERVRNGVSSFQELQTKAHYSAAQASRLEADYAFLLGLRSTLHWLCGRRIDVLETGLQPAVAELYGFGTDGAGRMIEKYYQTVRRIRNVLLAFLETDSSGRNLWNTVRKKVSANALAPGIAVLDGILYSTRSDDPAVGSPLWIMELFRLVIKHKATLSVEMRNRIRHFVAHEDPRKFRSQPVINVLKEILSLPDPISPAVQMMHETALLERLIPQFQVLTCKVEYDAYHEFTVDQHILLALHTAEAMVSDSDEKLRLIYSNLPRPFLVRLAILLHDIGKSQDGNHAKTGVVMAGNICERLGLGEEETERVLFLVLHHLDMAYLSFQREAEDRDIRNFSRVIGDLENLDMLYVLTIADIRSVGRHTWTDWKAFQLEQLYDRIAAVIEGGLREEPMEGRGPGVPGPADTAIPDDAYCRDTTPEERQRHLDLLDAVDDEELVVHHESFTGFERLTVSTRDRMGLLGSIIGCMSSEGYNILSARVYSTADGKVLDIFDIEPPLRPRISPAARLENIRKKWRLIVRGQATADSLVTERIRKYPPPPLRIDASQPPVLVRIDNEGSPLYTVVEIDTPDNFGILHRIARCLSECRVNIVSARLSTRVDLAVDVFYVTDGASRKITDPGHLDRIKTCLIDALTRGL